MAEKKKKAETAKKDDKDKETSKAKDSEKEEAAQDTELADTEEAVEENYDGVPLEKLPRRLRWKIKAKQFCKKAAAALLVVSAVGVVGLFLGAYLQIADLNQINEKYHMYDWPIVGEYFVKLPWERYAEYRAKKEEEERLAAEQEAARQANEKAAQSDAVKAKAEADKIAAETAKAKDEAKKAEEAKNETPEAIPAVQPPPEANQSPDIVITPEKIQKERKEREAAEKKRVTKLARLYNDMKPDESAKIIDNLEDDLAVAILQRMDESQSSKVLTKLDPAKAARYSNIIYTGRRTSLTSI